MRLQDLCNDERLLLDTEGCICTSESIVGNVFVCVRMRVRKTERERKKKNEKEMRNRVCVCVCLRGSV